MRNIIMLCVYFAIFKIVMQKNFVWYDGIILAFGVKDLYCVMLQRYNFLVLNMKLQRISKKRTQRVNRTVEKLKPNMQLYEYENSEKDIAFIKRLKQAILTNSDVIITSEDLETLHRLSGVLNYKQE